MATTQSVHMALFLLASSVHRCNVDTLHVSLGWFTAVTLGGIQSNHARATAVAARCCLLPYLPTEPFKLLPVSKLHVCMT